MTTPNVSKKDTTRSRPHSLLAFLCSVFKEHPNDRTRATYLPDNFRPLQDAGLLELVEGEAEVVPGVRVFPTPGHTADHQSVAAVKCYAGDLDRHRTSQLFRVVLQKITDA